MLVVTGLGRCGTSLVMKVLQDLDLNLGVNVQWIDEVNAGLELGSVHRINSEMYFRYLANGLEINLDDESQFRHWIGYTFRHILTKFDCDGRQGDFVEVVKDPRFTWHPELIRVWWKCRQDLRFLILHRDPQTVLNSRISLGEHEDPKPGRMKDVNVFKTDFCDCLTEIMKLDIPYELLYYPNFCFSPETLFKSLCALCDRFKPLKDDFFVSWDRMFDPTFIHH